MGHSTCSASLLLRCRGEEPKGSPVAWKRSKERGQHGEGGVLTGRDLRGYVHGGAGQHYCSRDSVRRPCLLSRTHIYTPHFSVQVDNGLYE